MMNKQGMLIVYSGPSGVGKGTLLTPYRARHERAVLSVSMTTRQPRPGELDGREYFFVTRAAFERSIASGELLEYAHYSGNYYGTPRRAVEQRIADGYDVVLEIEVQGARKIREAFPEAVFIFVLPPSYEALRERLVGRATESAEAVAARLETAREELRCAKDYDYVIVNDDVEQAVEQLGAVIEAGRYRVKNMCDFIEKVCDCI